VGQREILKRICVFCGSSKGANSAYSEAARQLGLALVRRGIGLVYGGGNIGLMGVIADTVLKADGEAIGVIPEALEEREVAHTGLTKLHVVGSMHERKALMAELSDGFIALPGGFGPYEEFCEVITWSQLGIHAKPCGMLNVEGYYNTLIDLFDKGVEESFIRPEHRRIVLTDTEPEKLLNKMSEFRAPEMGKWLDLDRA
jgi:uncharacterized protein (TIGR00730 family)